MITTATAITAILLVIMTFAVPRRFFLLPYILAACFVPADQRVIILTLDFTVLRILILAGISRILFTGEKVVIPWSRFDKLVLAWALCGAVIYIIQRASIGAFVYKSGVLLDVLGLYWLFRQSIRSFADIRFVITLLAWCALIMLPFIVLERMIGRNPFDYLGRVHTVFREGEFRCQGPFPHSIIMGLFWVTLFPIFVSLTRGKQPCKLFWAAAAACTFMVYLTASSTPVLALMSVLFFLFLFRYRRHGRQMAWVCCGLLLALHIVMQAPVWHLISRVGVFGGSTGWHRFNLIDKTISHFGEWVFLGTRSTDHWGHGLADLTCQYSLEAVRGGLLTLVVFIILIVEAVRMAGKWSLSEVPTDRQWFAWGVCVSMIGHSISFFAVSYFGQITILLFMTFAMVGLVAEKLSGSTIIGRNRTMGGVIL